MWVFLACSFDKQTSADNTRNSTAICFCGGTGGSMMLLSFLFCLPYMIVLQNLSEDFQNALSVHSGWGRVSPFGGSQAHSNTYSNHNSSGNLAMDARLSNPWIEHRTNFYRISSVSLTGRDVCFTLILRKIKSLTHFSW